MKKKDEYVYGLRPVIEAIKTGKTIERLLIKKGLKGALYHELKKEVKEHDIPYQLVPGEKLNRTTGKNHQGVIAWFSAIDYSDIANILPSVYESGHDPFILILDNISDVRNFGAIARTAECFGVHCIVIPEKGSARINAEAVKTSAGALNIIPVSRVKSITGTVSFLKNSGLKIAGASEKGNINLPSSEIKGPIALIMGSEDRGISFELSEMIDLNLRIPLSGKIESLNVSVAAGIMLYQIAANRY